VVYLADGAELFRSNMPAGAITNQTLASGNSGFQNVNSRNNSVSYYT